MGTLTPTAGLDLTALGVRDEHFLLCGARRGSADLTLHIRDPSGALVQSVWRYLAIRDIKEMYERWTVGETGSKAPWTNAVPAAEDLPASLAAFQYTPSGDTNTPYILYVHGWNMERWDKDRYAETAYKRLYWQGYQGRFGSFRWPTYYDFPLTIQSVPTTHFDRSEFNAWRSGAPLRTLLVDLHGKYPGQVRLMAHSMGNVAAGEALRTNVTLVHTYVAMQAAIAAHAYDAAVTNRDMGLFGPSTPNRYAEFWTNGLPCYFNGAAGASRYVNFFNKDDWALGWWELDQNLKPNTDAFYNYQTGQNGEERYSRGEIFEQNLNLPQDTYEVFPFIIEGRSFALGAQAGVHGAFRIIDQVDLRVIPFEFGEAHKGHSGQFRSTNMKRQIFWERALQTMQLK